MHGPSNRRRSSRRFHSPRPTAPHAHAQSTQVPSPRPCGPQSLRRARGFTVVPSTLVVGRLALTGASQSVYCALPTVLWLWCRGSSYLFSSSPRRPHSSVLLALAVLVYLDRPVTHGNLRTTYTRLNLLKVAYALPYIPSPSPPPLLSEEASLLETAQAQWHIATPSMRDATLRGQSLQ